MGVSVRIPSVLRQYTEQKSEIVLEGKTVREVLENLKARFPALDAQVFSSSISASLMFCINDRDVRSLGGLDTRVEGKDTLSMVLAISGG